MKRFVNVRFDVSLRPLTTVQFRCGFVQTTKMPAFARTKLELREVISQIASDIRREEVTAVEIDQAKTRLFQVLERIALYCPEFELVLACIELVLEINDNEDEQVRLCSHWM
jgi:hypothetical protein